ncbi:N-formylglutamate deformylase [Labrenzia sp. CE80]|uniref:N-formylglutamate deformylase n=1 Tax=Labrenzia sp. CE80 TaxID=1788986 RepID=UPI00129C032C|nr:N-formylglutamate deformylase [Labrenzia sp. CE80]
MIEITEGSSPLVLGLPHTGTTLPEDIAGDFNEVGRALADTDWHIHDLYAGLVDATIVRTPIHRYVIDVNRDPSGDSLYPGQNTTTLCPLTDFDGRPIYAEGKAPKPSEIERRCAVYHAPYHAALEAQLARIKAQHGFAILYDCHSIRGNIPFLFDGRLPDLNIGTNSGSSCATSIETLVEQACIRAGKYSHVVNGRFKGGWTTRHYGRVAEHLHAIQMELAQATYMAEAPPWTFRPEKANKLRDLLREILTTLTNWKPA